jgi:hypothetical protein
MEMVNICGGRDTVSKLRNKLHGPRGLFRGQSVAGVAVLVGWTSSF